MDCLGDYKGYEVGTIRPPSEAESLLVRITRNCPWNRCKFCDLYKGTEFSVRPKDHVLADIDMVYEFIEKIEGIESKNDKQSKEELVNIRNKYGKKGEWAYYSAVNWKKAGIKSIFLQDANSLVIKPEDMIEILRYIRGKFPKTERITSYARSHTIARISGDNLKKMADAGLNRIHIGMESASDKILKLIDKGVKKEDHIIAGKKVRLAGIELSEYFMPGLGGSEYSYENAVETADAMNQIDPNFIRIRTLAVKDGSELSREYSKKVFTRIYDDKVVEELLLFIKNLNGITSILKSDHILNLLPELEGKFPEDKEKMITLLEDYLSLESYEKIVFRVGRRSGVMNELKDLKNSMKRMRVETIIKEQNITEKNIDNIIDETIKRFI